MGKTLFSILVIIVLVFVGVSQVLFAIDETEMAIVVRLGAYQRSHTTPGLQVKTPFVESVTKFDKRLLRVDVQTASVLTSDKRNLLIDAYARYRIKDPLMFYRTLRDVPQADARVGDIVNAQMRREVALDLQEEVISETREDIMNKVTEASNRSEISREEAIQIYGTLSAGEVTVIVTEKDSEGRSSRGRHAYRSEIADLEATGSISDNPDTEVTYYFPLSEKYGIEIVDVRIKRADFPSDIANSVFARMEAERERIAKGLRAEGAQMDAEIRANVDRQVQIILETAKGKASLLQGEAEEEAINILAESLGKDPEFYDFRRSLEAYKLVIDSQTSLVLDPDSDLLKYLESPAER